MKMNCENEYCIYNRNKTCLLDEIELDDMGVCMECILVNLSQTEIENAKEKQLNDLIKRDEYLYKDKN